MQSIHQNTKFSISSNKSNQKSEKLIIIFKNFYLSQPNVKKIKVLKKPGKIQSVEKTHTIEIILSPGKNQSVKKLILLKVREKFKVLKKFKLLKKF